MDVPDDQEEVSIKIELWEDDSPGDGPSDMLCDISSTGKKCNITYNLRNGTWWGDDHVLDTDFIGRTCGEVDGNYNPALDANVIFEVSQNDYDNDGITYWQEINVYNRSIHPENENNMRYAVIVGGGASCKMKQTEEIDSSDYKGTYLLYDKGSDWTDYTFYVDLMTDFSSRLHKTQIGAIFRYQDQDNYYTLRWQQFCSFDRMFLQKMEGGQLTTLCDKRTPLTRMNWYTLKIKLDSNNIKVWINNNRNSELWWKIFDISDDQDDPYLSGSVALFCWNNKGVWFDDILVIDHNNDDLLLQEGFDYERFYDWTVNDEAEESNWILTNRVTDQDEFYKEPDFVYRVFRIIGHYGKNNINYLSADKWRDADGDGTNDVNSLSIKRNVKKSLKKWLKSKSDCNDLNFVYLFDHGYYNETKDTSYLTVDNNRNGKVWDEALIRSRSDFIFDYEVDRWLPRYGPYPLGIGRLTLLIEACRIGHFIDALSHSFQKRIIITTSTISESAEPETGQDWAAFTHMFFRELSDGETNVADAFNVADEHHQVKNFWSAYMPTIQEPSLPPANATLDDNGDKVGSDYALPNGNWHCIYQGIFPNQKWVTKKIICGNGEYCVTKARVRFLVQCGNWTNVTAKLYEFGFHGASWVFPDGHNDPDNAWDDEENAFDNNTATNAGCTINESGWTPYLYLTLSEPLKCDKIRFNAWFNLLHCGWIIVDVYFIDGCLAAKTGL